jgi:hypothetical protein
MTKKEMLRMKENFLNNIGGRYVLTDNPDKYIGIHTLIFKSEKDNHKVLIDTRFNTFAEYRSEDGFVNLFSFSKKEVTYINRAIIDCFIQDDLKRVFLENFKDFKFIKDMDGMYTAKNSILNLTFEMFLYRQTDEWFLKFTDKNSDQLIIEFNTQEQEFLKLKLI